MKELTPKQSRFYKRWSVQRKSRWGYILYKGPLLWAAVGSVILAAEAAFRIESFTPLNFILKLLFFALLGVFASYNNFKINEKIFKTYLDEEEAISNGIARLERRETWEFENLRLMQSGDKSLTIRNQLFWLKTDHPTPKELEECMQSLRNDLDRLLENKEFTAFAENKKIQLQLFSNQDKANPLLEEVISIVADRPKKSIS